MGHNHTFWYDEAEKRFIEVEVVRKRDGLVQWCVASGVWQILGGQNACLSNGSHTNPLIKWTYAALLGIILHVQVNWIDI